MFQRFGCDYNLERVGLARTIIHRTFGRFGMHGADHDPPLEGEWPFLETVDVAASPNEYGFKFWRQSDCLSPPRVATSGSPNTTCSKASRVDQRGVVRAAAGNVFR